MNSLINLATHRLTLLLTAMFLFTALAPAATAEPRKLNILFIMVDDLGPEWISACGSQSIKTPHIDALARGGLRFLNAYSMPQCTPTRATLLTGQYPFRHGWCNHWDVPRWGAGCHFDPKHNMSFARIMKAAGYSTAIAGKWQINDFRVQPDILKQHGFDSWCMWTGFEAENKPSAERYWDPYIYTSSAASKIYPDKFGPDLYTDHLIQFMKDNRDQPLMMYFPMVLTHGPLIHTPTEPKVQSKVDKHKAMVRYTDGLVGKLVAAIDDLALRSRTVIIFTTDNGTSGGIRGVLNGRTVRGGKAKLTENGPRQPFIVNCPGLVPSGKTTDALTDFTDLLPTFAELGGATLPKDLIIDGHSLAPVMLGKAQDGPRDWIMAMGFGPARLDAKGVRPRQLFTDRVIRDKQHKIFVIDGQVTRLHDLSKDPVEEDNLIRSTQPAHLAALHKLTAVLKTFPEQDGRPRYDPTAAQPWDKKMTDPGFRFRTPQGN
jgi:arylsulfatase A-like enzyme